ncbi:MAG: CoA transferase [Gammaproteobacteria bacterium]|nr:CoA transferase [Gammaproteobacteria bacterium]
MSDSTPRPLEGMRVLELGQILAGPFASTLLGYYGAEIIKVEPPGTGDPIRTWRLVKDGTSLWWWSHARNKKSVTINLKTDEGCALVRDLVRECDVVVENFRPGQMEKWGLGPEVLREINPALIYTRVSGYGQTGPYANRPGFASVCEGFGGFRYVNGVPGEPPVRPNISLGDTLAGMHAAFGVLLAYVHRLRGNPDVGQIVDVSIFESVFNMLEGIVPEYSGAGVVRQPSGSTITGIVPSNTYRCGDGKLIVIGANTNSMFKRLMDAMDRNDMATDERYAENAGRVEHQDTIDGTITAWAGTLTAAEALAVLEGAGVASGPIYSVEDMFNDPQYQARGLFEQVDINGEALDIPAIVPRLSETPGRTDTPGPTLGAHTDEVLDELLGIDAGRRAALREQGVI